MKVQYTLNKKGNVTTRKVRGTYVSCIYSGKIFDPDEIAVSISEMNSAQNVWISLDYIDDLKQDFEQLDRNNFDDFNGEGFGFQDGLNIGEHTYIYRDTDDYDYKCSYCGNKHEDKNIVLFFSKGKPPLNKVVDNKYISKGLKDKLIINRDCVYDLIKSLEKVPKELKSYNKIAEL